MRCQPLLALVVTVVTLAAGCVPSVKIKTFEAKAPAAAPAKTRSLYFTRLGTDIPAGQQVGTLKVGLLCEPRGPAVWSSAMGSNMASIVGSAFEHAAEKAGYRVIRREGASSLFEDRPLEEPDVLVAVLLRSLAFNVCHGGVITRPVTSGEASIELEWQIFDRQARRVIAAVTTGGTARTQHPGRDNKSIYEAALVAARNALAVESFVAALTATEQSVAREPRLPELVIALAPLSEESRGDQELIEVVRRSVVSVNTDTGFGSGFIVSAAGMVLTSAHVVEGSDEVTATLATGQEVRGRIVRRSVGADVALIQLAEGTYPAAPVGDSRKLRVGSSVFAIGSPLGQHGTVTRGIVSAMRTAEAGGRLIQSDVTVHPGSSGGPLLDESGRVVAITRSGLGPRHYGVGINNFIPIEDAWAGLHVRPEQRPGGSIDAAHSISQSREPGAQR